MGWAAFQGRQVERARRAYWGTRFGSFGYGSQIARTRRLTNPGRIHLGSWVEIGVGARLEVVAPEYGGTAVGEILIGDKTKIEDFVHIGAAGSVTLGAGCLLASHVYISDHDHGLTGPPERISRRPLIVEPVVLGERVWLGQNVCVLKGVRIGDDAVIGAGSVVTRDVPARLVAAGVPAKVIRRLS